MNFRIFLAKRAKNRKARKGKYGAFKSQLGVREPEVRGVSPRPLREKQKNPRQHFRQKPQNRKQKHKSKHEDFSFFPITSLSKPEFEAFFDKIILILPFLTGQNAKIAKLTIKIGF
jgi:hypothetical protein